MDAIRKFNHDHKIDRCGLVGLVLLGLMFWGASSLWDSGEAHGRQLVFEMLTSGTTAIVHHQATSTAYPATHPPDRMHPIGATPDASAPFEKPRERTNKPIDTRRHPFHTIARDRRFAALLLLLANSHH